MKNKIWSLFAICSLLTAFIVFSTLSDANAAQTSQARRTLDADAPYEEFLQVTPSNSITYDPPLRGCIIESVSGGTNLVITTTKGASVTITVAAAQEIKAMITVVGASTDATVICGR